METKIKDILEIFKEEFGLKQSQISVLIAVNNSTLSSNKEKLVIESVNTKCGRRVMLLFMVLVKAGLKLNKRALNLALHEPVAEQSNGLDYSVLDCITTALSYRDIDTDYLARKLNEAASRLPQPRSIRTILEDIEDIKMAIA